MAEAATASGDLADIAYERGEYEEAEALQSKRLAANQRLGDLDGIGAASWGLAQISFARDDYAAAFPRLV